MLRHARTPHPFHDRRRRWVADRITGQRRAVLHGGIPCRLETREECGLMAEIASKPDQSHGRILQP
jgi:hypothetical protein